MLHAQEDALHQHVHGDVEVLDGCLVDGPECAAETGVVEDAVEPTPRALDPRHGVCEVCFDRDVDAFEERCFAEFLRQGAAGLLLQIREQDARPVGDEHARGGGAHAARGAGDEGDLVAESCHGSSLCGYQSVSQPKLTVPGTTELTLRPVRPNLRCSTVAPASPARAGERTYTKCFPEGEPWKRWRVAEYGRCVAQYDAEQLVGCEAGFKSTLGDGRLRCNGAAFFYDYSDLQVYAFVVVGGSGFSTMFNATDADVYGLEFELQRLPVDRLFVRIAWISADDRWEVAASGRNLADEQYMTYGFDLSFFGFNEEMLGSPRFVGMDATYRF